MTGRVSGVLGAHGFVAPQDLRAKIIALDEEFAAMEKQITVLNAENLKLKADNGPLQRELDRYKKQAQLKGGLHLAAEEEKIMRMICSKQKAMFCAEIAQAVDLNAIRTNHFLEKLIERDLVQTRDH